MGPPASKPTWATRPGRSQIGRAEAGAAGLQSETRKAFEDDAGEIVPVADDVGEDADKQRLLHKARQNVVTAIPGPEQRGKRHIDDDQCGGEKGDLAAKQAEPGIDVTGENFQETVDDAGTAHAAIRFPG